MALVPTLWLLWRWDENNDPHLQGMWLTEAELLEHAKPGEGYGPLPIGERFADELLDWPGFKYVDEPDGIHECGYQWPTHVYDPGSGGPVVSPCPDKESEDLSPPYLTRDVRHRCFRHDGHSDEHRCACLERIDQA